MNVGVGQDGLAFIKDGAFVDLYNGHVYTEAEIIKRLNFLHSEQGFNFIMKYSGAL